MKTIPYHRYFNSTTPVNPPSLVRYTAGLLIVGLLASFSPTILAAENNSAPQTQQRQTKKTPALREKIYKVLSEAQAKSEENKPDEAIKALDRLKKGSDLNSYESAMMWKFYAYIYYSQDNHDQAIYSYEQLLKQDALPEALESEALYSTAQLYFVKENYNKAINYLNRWFTLTDSPKAQAYIMLGQAYYQLGQMDKALKPITTAIAMEEKGGKRPKESWYLLLRALYFEQNNYKEGAKVLEKLVAYYPKKEYWVQLSGVYGELKQETKQLSSLEIAYRQGLLNKESEWLTLAQLLIANDVPYKAAKVIERGVKEGIIKEDKDNLKLLSYAWSTAQEAKKALPILAKAAETSQSGEIDIQLGSTYYQLDEWNKSVTYLRKGIKKGDVKRKDNAYMLLGMALFNLNQFEDAQYAFKEAAKSKDSKASATQWLNYVGKEIERRDMLAQTMKAMEAQQPDTN
ncbi:tetratricopeptide repeat protein [Ketobacter sp. MCCC 1A13808]|uniref:tetratricopeptide repeat protein n=1 Tax=Ketobacter sp. MCCC 1A13808 TaxID=2602738 RepID=UPI000F123508|nr:CDC27 family protein [Ketobacter sp. MCCC 1A13808]MVF12143.1 tetratricopeptide repeat protein [Ketobacter sp. MCCC 1A13808]RLP53201.1 MAG: hypothetical protein D6160_16955 [Ketobacter sp.]